MTSPGVSKMHFGFLSGQEGRDTWVRDQDAPFSEPFRAKVPGPGYYMKLKKELDANTKLSTLLDCIIKYVYCFL